MDSLRGPYQWSKHFRYFRIVLQPKLALVVLPVMLVMSIVVLMSYSPPYVPKSSMVNVNFGADIGVLEMNRSSDHHGLLVSSGISKQLFMRKLPVKLITPPNPNMNMLIPASRSMTQGSKLFPFYFVHGNFVKSPKKIFSSPWLIRLQEMLGSLQDSSKAVSVVFSDSEYVESLLNWLIASQRIEPPLRNLIVVCLDEIVFSMLEHRDISLILIDPAMVLNSNAKKEKDTRAKFLYIWVVRFVVYRMITYFGYDVTSYDTDAILMKNPEPLFEKYKDSDIVGSAGSFPFSLGRLWGFTVCMGVIRFKNRPNSELIWELMSRSKAYLYDDQLKLNFALKNCGIKWQAFKNTSSSINISSISGQCSLPPYQGLKVTILPYSEICRKCINNREYFVAHPLSEKIGTAKVAIAAGTEWWFLRKDWRRFCGDGGGSLKGIKWLATLMDTSNIDTSSNILHS